MGERGRALQIRELVRIKKGREKTVFCKLTSLAETDLFGDNKSERKSKMSQMAVVTLTTILVLF